MTKQRETDKTRNMIQTAVWLPRGMHEDLKHHGGERGLGDEIRRRLLDSLDAEPRDRKTAELLDAINRIEARVDEEPWYASRFAFEVFKAAINELLSNYQPDIGVPPGAVSKLQADYGPEAKPETIGRILARIAFKDAVAKRQLEQLRRANKMKD